MRGWRRLIRPRQAMFESTRWRLHVSRLGSFLGHARSIRGMVDDAREKYEGDFIFDSQFSVAVVDGTLEHLDGLLFDAAVLGLETRSLEDLCQNCQVAAEGLYKTKAGIEEPEGQHPDDPELAHLRRVLSWMEGPILAGCLPVMSLVCQTVDALFQTLRLGEPPLGARDLPTLALPRGGLVEIVDLGRGLSASAGPEVAISDLRCKPLILLLTGAIEALVLLEESPSPAERWLAVIDNYHLGLRRRSGEPTLFLEALHTGGPGKDWLFVYETGSVARQGWPISPLRAEPTEAGRSFWYVGDWDEMEDLLIQVGASLVGGVRGSQKPSSMASAPI